MTATEQEAPRESKTEKSSCAVSRTELRKLQQLAAHLGESKSYLHYHHSVVELLEMWEREFGSEEQKP